jgi:carbamoylphosphate synthase large subunit
MRRILVSGCGGSAGNNFIRSLRLAQEEFYIVGTDINKYHIKLSTADKSYLVPYCNSPDYISSLNEIIKKEKIEFVHCQPDPELYVLSKQREKINAPMFLPSKQAIKLAENKLQLIKKLRINKVPAPCSCHIDNHKDLKTAIEMLEAKGNKKFWVRAIKGAGSRGALPVINETQAKNWIDYWDTMKDLKWGQFMISEFLPGKEYAFQSVWYNGHLVASAARERMEYLFGNRMPSGQSSSPTIAKTVHNEEVNKVAVAGIKVLDPIPNGIYCVDMKEDKYGVPNITEINAGRFFTTSIFITTAGCNMPYIYTKLAFGEEATSLPYNSVPKDLYWIRQIDCPERIADEISLGSN